MAVLQLCDGCGCEVRKPRQDAVIIHAHVPRKVPAGKAVVVETMFGERETEEKVDEFLFCLECGPALLLALSHKKRDLMKARRAGCKPPLRD